MFSSRKGMKEGLFCFCNRWTASGDLSYLDQLEKIAFNAMPAPFFNGSMVCGKQHFPVVAPCLIKGLNICQDRLGTKLESWTKGRFRAGRDEVFPGDESFRQRSLLSGVRVLSDQPQHGLAKVTILGLL